MTRFHATGGPCFRVPCLFLPSRGSVPWSSTRYNGSGEFLARWFPLDAESGKVGAANHGNQGRAHGKHGFSMLLLYSPAQRPFPQSFGADF